MTMSKIGGSTVKPTKLGDVEVWAPEGRVDAVSSPDLQEATTESIANGARKLVLDLSSTQYMSSAGLRVVLLVARAMQSKNGKFVICGLNDEVHELFQISGFSQIVDIVADRKAALNSLR